MSFEIHQADGYLHILATGEVTLGSLAGIGREIEQIENTRAVAPHRLLDFTHSGRVEINYEVIAGFAQRRSTRVLKNPIRLAVVAPTDHHFGVARMFQTLVHNPQIEFRIFRREAPAVEWLSSLSPAPAEPAAC